MDGEIAADLDSAFKKCKKDPEKFLLCVAEYLRTETDLYSRNHQQIIKASFDLDERNGGHSPEIPLQSINNTRKGYTVPETEIAEETSRDLFDEEQETQFDNDESNNDQVIIPETQFDPNDSMSSDVSDFLNTKYKAPDTKDEEHNPTVVRSEPEDNHDDAESGDYVQVAANESEEGPELYPMESQALMANLDRSILVGFDLIDANESNSLSSTRIETESNGTDKKVAETTVHSDQSQKSKNDSTNQKRDSRSGTATPDMDFDGADNEIVSRKEATVEKAPKSATSNNANQMDTEDLFNMCTQPVPKVAGPKSKTMTSKNAVGKGPNNKKICDDDVFDAPTQRLSPVITKVFAMPRNPAAPAKKNSTTEPLNDSDSFFDVATQPFVQPTTSKAPKNPFEQTTPLVVDDDIFEVATQVQSNTNDIFDAPTQRMQVLDKPKSPEASGKVAAQREYIPFNSQPTQLLTPEWSVAKMIPVESANQPAVSEKEKKLIKNHQWLFNDSSDEDNDDLEFDLTPPQPVRVSLFDIVKTEKLEENKGTNIVKPKVVNEQQSKRKRVENVSTSQNDVTPSKRTRSVSIVLSRKEVEDLLKEANDTTSKINSKKVEKSSKKLITVVEESPATTKATRKLRQRHINSPDVKEDKHNGKKKNEADETVAHNRSGTKRTHKAVTTPIEAPQAKERKKGEKPKENKPSKIQTINPIQSSTSASSARRQSDRTLRQKFPLKSPVNVLFTKINAAAYTKIVKDLGGFIVDTPQLGSVLVCDQTFRTFKFLFALCKGIPIVTSKWLDTSHRFGFFLPVDQYILADEKAEKRFHFELKKSLEIARNTKLFASYYILATPSSQPTPSEIAEIVQCGGGEFSFNTTIQRKSNKKIVLITEKKDKRLWKTYQQIYPDIEIVGSEGFMQSVVRQKIVFSNYLMK